MSQPNQPAPAPTPQAPDAAVPGKKVKKVKDDSGGGGGIGGIFSKITRKLVWVFSGIIFAGIFFWGLIEIAFYGPTPNVPIAGLVGKFSIDRFMAVGGGRGVVHSKAWFWVPPRILPCPATCPPSLMSDAPLSRQQSAMFVMVSRAQMKTY